jgi:hypothetical protein
MPFSFPVRELGQYTSTKKTTLMNIQVLRDWTNVLEELTLSI